MLENPPVPFLAPLADLGKNNLKANFSFSFKFAEAILTLHFKTGGIKEVLGLWWKIWKYIINIYYKRTVRFYEQLLMKFYLWMVLPYIPISKVSNNYW